MAIADQQAVLQLLINGQDNTGKAIGSAQGRLQRFEGQVSKLSDSIKGLLTFTVLIRGMEQFNKLSDEYTNLSARIKNATRGQMEFRQVMEGLYRISQETGGQLESNVTLYARTADALRGLNLQTELQLRLVELVAKSYKLSGASNAEAAGGVTQLAQALGAGVLRGDEFNSMMDSSPRLAKALADGLGVPIGQLRALAEAGQLTADKVIKALLGQGDKINAEYGQIGNTAEKAHQQISSAIARQIGLLSDSSGATRVYADAIGYLATKIDGYKIEHSVLAEMMALQADATKIWSGQQQEGYAKIHARFEAYRNGTVEGNRQISDSEQAKAATATQAATVQADSLDKLQDKLKAATGIIEGQYNRQIEAINRQTAAKITQIQASESADNAAALRTAMAEREAFSQRLQAIADYGQRRLSAITQILGTQEQIEKISEVNRAATEKTALEARQSAYQDLAKAYGSAVDQIQAQWQREMALYQTGTKSLQDLSSQHEQGLLAIQRLGMTEREKLRSQEVERDAAISKFKAEAAKGEKADNAELNRLYGEAYKLVGQVSQAKVTAANNAIDKSTAIHQGERLLNELYQSQSATLSQITQSHRNNANALLPTLDSAKAKLSEVNLALQAMDRQLAEAKQLQISVDPNSFQQTLSAIRELTKPEEKLITIRTISIGGGQAVQAKADGGYISKLASGGLLPGYGGGDRVPALLEDGEFVVNKASTRAFLPLLEAINRPRRFASGGLVDKVFEQSFNRRLDDKLTTLGNLSTQATSSLGGGEWGSMYQLLSDIDLAISRAPANLRDRLKQSVAERLAGLQAQAEQARDIAAERDLDPLSTLRTSPGILQKLEDSVRFFSDAITRFGSSGIGDAALGGFAPYNPAKLNADLTHVSRRFDLPTISFPATAQMPVMRGSPSSSQTGRTVRHVIEMGGASHGFDVSESTSSSFEAGLAALVIAKKLRA